MEIQALKLFVTDADLATFVTRHAKSFEAIEELTPRFTPEGVIVTGKYPTSLLNVSFETMWQVSGSGAVVRVKLANVRVAGLPANMLRGAMMKMVRDAIENMPGLSVENDSVLINLVEVAVGEGVDLKVNVTAVRLSIGAAVVEAG